MGKENGLGVQSQYVPRSFTSPALEPPSDLPVIASGMAGMRLKASLVPSPAGPRLAPTFLPKAAPSPSSSQDKASESGATYPKRYYLMDFDKRLFLPRPKLPAATLDFNHISHTFEYEYNSVLVICGVNVGVSSKSQPLITLPTLGIRVSFLYHTLKAVEVSFSYFGLDNTPRYLGGELRHRTWIWGPTCIAARVSRCCPEHVGDFGQSTSLPVDPFFPLPF
ncbi:hypothetical protein IMZ48_10420 [Candidatus Bathyarchaeota archaeon]|nr:hypothetical protein [Candidatus Bathyarchaeota archaeon]